MLRAFLVVLVLLPLACAQRRGSACDECPTGQICDEAAGECVECTPNCTDKGCGDDGCGGSCGTCLEGEACTNAGLCIVCTPKTCEELGAECGGADNGCEGIVTCGGCASPLVCQANRCVEGGCVAQTCQQQGIQCGAADDGCGEPIQCGNCPTGQRCGGGGGPGKCGTGECAPETDRQFCLRLGKQCGSVTAFDNCDASRTVSCGTCTSPETCGGAGVENRCGCAGAESDATLCSNARISCGSIQATDKCGVVRTLACGSCTAPNTCGGGGTQGQCGCKSRLTDAQLCQQAGAQCDTLEGVVDDCGKTRTPRCGTCASPKTCEGGAIPNKCGGWTQVTYPGGEVEQLLSFGPSDVWALSNSFGTNGTYHWTGSSWQTITNFDYDKMGGSSSSNIILVSGFAGIARWNGSALVYDIVSPFGSNETPLSVATTGANAIWISTTSGVRYWNGSTWTLSARASGRLIHALWAASATDVFGVGENGSIIRWNGSTWNTMTSPTTLGLSAIDGTGPNDVWAGGDGLAALHWDGSRWSIVKNPDLDGASAIAATSTDVWLTGLNTAYLRLHKEGTQWVAYDGYVSPPNMGAVSASSATDVWLGGNAMTTGQPGSVFRLIP